MRTTLIGLVFVAGCPICDCSSAITVVTGSRDVSPGDVVELRAESEGWTSGPGECGGHWYVNGVESGTAELGTVDSCGRYQAPAAFPAALAYIEIEAMEHPLGECADCCAYASVLLYPRR